MEKKEEEEIRTQLLLGVKVEKKERKKRWRRRKNRKKR